MDTSAIVQARGPRRTVSSQAEALEKFDDFLRRQSEASIGQPTSPPPTQAPQAPSQVTPSTPELTPAISGHGNVPPEPGFFSRVGTHVNQLVTGEGIRDDFPELPGAAARGFPVLGSEDGLHLTTPLAAARTPEGQLNLLRQRYPQARLAGQDQYGNPLVSLGEPLDEFGADQPFYTNKPGLSWRDLDSAEVAAGEMAPAVLASVLSGGAGVVPAAAAAGTTTAGTRGLRQLIADRAGAAEGFDPWDVAVAGALGAGGEVTGRVVGAGINAARPAIAGVVKRLLGKPAAVDGALVTPAGQLTPRARDALEQAGIDPNQLADAVKAHLDAPAYGQLPPEQRVIAAEFESLGVKPKRGDLSQRFEDQQFETEIAKDVQAGDPMRARNNEQNRTLNERLGELRDGTGGQLDEPVAVGESVRTDLDALYKREDVKVNLMYKAVREQLGDGATISPDGLVRHLSDEALDFANSVPAVRDVAAILKRRGIVDDDGNVVGMLTAETAEQLRKKIGALARSSDPNTSRIMGDLRDALDDDVGETAFEGARGAAAEKFKTFRDRKLVRDIVQGRLADDDLVRKVITTGKVKELRELRATLIQSGGPGWDNLRRAAMAHLMDKAKAGNAVTELGDPVLSGANLKKAMQALTQPKMMLLFTADERQALGSIARVLDRITTKVPGADNRSGSSSALINFVKAKATELGAAFPDSMIGLLKMVGREADNVRAGREINQALDPALDATIKARRRQPSLPPAAQSAGRLYGGQQDAEAERERLQRQRPVGAAI